MKMLKDIWNQMTLRLKLLFKDKAALLVLVLCGLCFWFCMEDFNQGAEERAGIPIGIVNQAQKEQSAQALIERLKQQSALYVTVGNYKELEQKMLDGYIRCILVIQEGYEEKLRQGNVKNLIAVYREEKDNVAVLITDIVAGEMLYDICLARSYQVYEELPASEKQKYTREEYEAYAASLIEKEDFDFAFSFRFVDTKGGESSQKAGNSLFYRQAVAAAAAVLFALLQFLAMSGLVFEKEQGIALRRRLLVMGRFSQAAGNILAAGILAVLPCVIFTVCTCKGSGRWEIFFPIFWTSVLFSVMMGIAYYLWADFAHNLFSYQIGGAVFLLLTGIAGFCSMAEGVAGEFPVWLDLVPNCMYLKWFTYLLR